MTKTRPGSCRYSGSPCRSQRSPLGTIDPAGVGAGQENPAGGPRKGGVTNVPSTSTWIRFLPACWCGRRSTPWHGEDQTETRDAEAQHKRIPIADEIPPTAHNLGVVSEGKRAGGVLEADQDQSQQRIPHQENQRQRETRPQELRGFQWCQAVFTTTSDMRRIREATYPPYAQMPRLCYRPTTREPEPRLRHVLTTR